MDFTKQIQKAEEALRRRNYDFAIELYRQLLDLNADLGEARAGLRRALHRRHESKKGGRLLRALKGGIPLANAKAMAKLGKHEACARALEDYLKSNPVDEEANLLLGDSLEAAGHLKSAFAVYEYVAEIAPKNPEGLKRAGVLAQSQSEPDKALDYFEKALAIDPRDQEAIKARKNLAAETALRASGLDDAAHSRERIVDQAEAGRLERARRKHLSSEELEAERSRLEGALAEAPSNPETWIALADVHEKLRDFESALDCVERAAQYKKDSFELLVRSGDLRVRLHKRAMAKADQAGDAELAGRLEAELWTLQVDDARARLAARPTDLALRLELGKRLFRAGELDEALAELQAARSEPRLRAEAAFHLGLCFQAKGVYDLAGKQLEEALGASQAGSERAKEILYTLGAIAEAAGDPAAARSYFVRVYEVDVGYRDVTAKIEGL